MKVTPSRSNGGNQKQPRVLLWNLLPSLTAGFVIPLLVYLSVRPLLGSDAPSLALAGATPLLWTAMRLKRHHRIDPLGAISVIGFAAALLLTALSRGNPFFLKVHEALLTGAVGVAALVSIAIRRPLLAVVLRRLDRPLPSESRRLVVATAIIGATLVIDATVRVVLALTLATTTYLVVHRIVSWTILGAGLVALLVSRRRSTDAPLPGPFRHEE